jgi:hypothetical protein
VELLSGAVLYSNRTSLDARKSTTGIHVFPNPITTGLIRIQMNELVPGAYPIRLMSSSGAVVHQEVVNYTGGFQSMGIQPRQPLAAGAYWLEFTSPSGKRSTLRVLVTR